MMALLSASDLESVILNLRRPSNTSAPKVCLNV